MGLVAAGLMAASGHVTLAVSVVQADVRVIKTRQDERAVALAKERSIAEVAAKKHEESRAEAAKVLGELAKRVHAIDTAIKVAAAERQRTEDLRDRVKALELLVSQIRDEQQRRTGRVYDVRDLSKRLREHIAEGGHEGAKRDLKALDRRVTAVELASRIKAARPR